MQHHKTKQTRIPTVSKKLDDGRIVELIYSPEERRTQFAVWDKTQVTYIPEITLKSGEVLIPVRAENNLLRHKAILLPACADNYTDTTSLIHEIRTYISRYVDLSEAFQEVAPLYVLLSWVYDTFGEVPYLRFRGDFGSGKTRALQVIGAIMYKPFFASGASTISPIFHTLDLFKGTLVFDEADFRYSDERSEIIKILNNGNMRGLPVLRTIVTPKHEFDPRAFSVFGPKLIAMRHSFKDEGLESRFLTEDMGTRPMRKDIPISLPFEQEAAALRLRNRLLMFRFRNLNTLRIPIDADPSFSARTNQVLAPLRALASTDTERDALCTLAARAEASIRTGRSESLEARIIAVLAREMREQDSITIRTLVQQLAGTAKDTDERPITYRYIGSLVRSRIRLPAYKTNGIYTIAFTEPVRVQIQELCTRYGVDT